jgi:hypothetical protein
VQFQTRTQQPSASEPTNASSICMTFITFFFFIQKSLSTLAFTLNLALAEEILVNHPVETSSPQHASLPRAEPSSAQVKILSSSGTQSPLLKQKCQLHQRWTHWFNQKLQAL